MVAIQNNYNSNNRVEFDPFLEKIISDGKKQENKY